MASGNTSSDKSAHFVRRGDGKEREVTGQCQIGRAELLDAPDGMSCGLRSGLAVGWTTRAKWMSRWMLGVATIFVLWGLRSAVSLFVFVSSLCVCHAHIGPSAL